MASSSSDSASDGLEWECPALFPELEKEFNPNVNSSIHCVLPVPAYFVFGSHAICLTSNPGVAISTKVWRGALVLAQALSAECELVDNMRVLDLGCGVGLLWHSRVSAWG